MDGKKKFKLTTLAIIVLAVAIISVGGFITFKLLSKPSTDEETNKEQEIKDVEKEQENENEPKIESKVKIIDVNSKTRPYAVMINCHSAALPQSGLQDAYIVYELMVESGITRMMALFKDVPLNKVGSVRSARVQYLAYVYENDAIYAHAGGQKAALNRIANEKISDVDVDGQYGQRDMELAKKRAWEHTLFTNTTLLAKGVSNKGIKTTTNVKNLLTYSEEELDLSKYKTTKANKISIKYSNYRTSIYDYDANKKVFLRSMNNVKNVDLVTGKQYEVKNILVYAVKHTTYDGKYQRLENIGTGEGYYITDGVALPIIWEKKDEKSQTVYKIKETGEDLVVNDGNTYIQIYPSNGGKLTIS